jgi:porphobilinogen synthase
MSIFSHTQAPLALPTYEKDAVQITKRPRRNRKSHAIRQLVQETRLHPSHFILPVFVVEGSKERIPIRSMPGICRLSIDELEKECEQLLKVGVHAIDIFCYVPEEKKDLMGNEARKQGSLLQASISSIKKKFPEMCVMADIALDPFTLHGHDGITGPDGSILNDATIIALAEMSLRAAEAGVDIIAPSDMMDGRVFYIRNVLDNNGFENVGILSYAAKYASSFYGPFREALDSAPKFGDKQSYQMNPANAREALLECDLDENEGADMLLIKPALTSLDIIAKAKEKTNLPIGAYQVSGEYSMIKAAAEKGWIHEDRAILETLLCIKRAGADFIFTYAALQAAILLAKGQ